MEAVLEWHKRSLKHKGSKKSERISIDEKAEWYGTENKRKKSYGGQAVAVEKLGSELCGYEVMKEMFALVKKKMMVKLEKRK